MWSKIFSVSRGKLISVICLLQLCYGDKWNCDLEGGEAVGATTPPPPQMQQPKTTAKSQPAKDDAPLREAPNDIGRHNERFASKVGFYWQFEFERAFFLIRLMSQPEVKVQNTAHSCQ